jgi:hypothetical protein
VALVEVLQSLALVGGVVDALKSMEELQQLTLALAAVKTKHRRVVVGVVVVERA